MCNNANDIHHTKASYKNVPFISTLVVAVPNLLIVTTPLDTEATLLLLLLQLAFICSEPIVAISV